MGDYRRLKVWHTAHRLTLLVYEVTRSFPSVERYGLVSQLRRAASSVPTNIAEGCGRNSDAELARFARIALGSANEVDYHLLLARDLGYLSRTDHQRVTGQLRDGRRMLAGLIDRVTDS